MVRVLRVEILVSTPNIIEVGWFTAEIQRYIPFQNVGLRPCCNCEICNLDELCLRMFFFSVPNYDFIGQEAYDQETIFNTAVVRRAELSILWVRSIKVTEQSWPIWLQFVPSFIRVRPVWEIWQAFVYSLKTVLRRVRTVGVGTPTILTHRNLNKRPAWRIALAKFILAVNLPL